ERQSYLMSQLATVDMPFAITGTSYTADTNLVVISGTAPVNVKSIVLNGLVYPVTWTTVTNFSVRVVLYQGLNQFSFLAQDRFGALIPGFLLTVDVDYPGPAANPVGAITISELMHRPSVPETQFIEIMNRSQFSFDLSFWRIDAVNYTFPIGSIVTAGQTI